MLALAGCGGGGSPPEAPVSELAELPLLELRIESQRGRGSELRVRADGRFEIRSDGDQWRLVSEYSESGLAELRREMERADDPPLPAVIDDGGPRSTDPTRMEWRLRLADDVREVVVEDWGDGVAPPLERLYSRLFAIPGGPAVESVWRVAVGHEVVVRHVIGEATGVPQLAAMLAALYGRPEPFAAEGSGSPPADPLVDVRHQIDGAPGDGFAVARDGRAFLTEGGATTEVRRLDADELAALHEAIERTGWPALPEPLAGDPGP